MDKLEKRTSKIEIRAKDDGTVSRTVRGYAAIFETDTMIGNWFIERIARGAFDESLNDDVRALFNHDQNMPLARTGAGLTLGVDNTGLYYEFDAPNTTIGNDLLTNIRAGIIKESSFAFTVKEQKWEDQGKQKPSIRTILKVDKLYDVSPVTYPAYADTTVAARSYKYFSEGNVKDLNDMDIDIMRGQIF